MMEIILGKVGLIQQKGPNGDLLSGWKLRNSNKQARIPEKHSETAFMTNRAIEFIKESKDRSWIFHLSYIKPHWPYMAPAPYHNMYSANQFYEVQRTDAEKKINILFIKLLWKCISKTFSRDEVRETVLAGYMGLIKQIDDNLGRLFKFLEQNNNMFQDTMIVFTSDHGDYLGDHWLGEKELFHEQIVRVPMIIYDPSENSK